MPVFSLVLNNHSAGDKDKYVIFREKNVHSLNAFKDDLGKVNWAELPGLDDPSCAYEIFIEKYVAIYDRCFPLKRKKAKRFNLQDSSRTIQTLKKEIVLVLALSCENCMLANLFCCESTLVGKTYLILPLIAVTTPVTKSPT